MTIKIYTAEHCAPCHDVMHRLKEQGHQIDGEAVEIIDVETDEGFAEFSREVLSQGDGAVPWATRDGERCLILHVEDGIALECPHRGDQEPPPASETG